MKCILEKTYKEDDQAKQVSLHGELINSSLNFKLIF